MVAAAPATSSVQAGAGALATGPLHPAAICRVGIRATTSAISSISSRPRSGEAGDVPSARNRPFGDVDTPRSLRFALQPAVSAALSTDHEPARQRSVRADISSQRASAVPSGWRFVGESRTNGGMASPLLTVRVRRWAPSSANSADSPRKEFTMSLRFNSRSVSAWGIARSVTTPALALAVTWAALLGEGCEAGMVSTESSGTTATDQQALLAVRTCQAQTRACMASGGDSECEDELRGCLSSSLRHDAGSPEERVSDEAGEREPDEDANPEPKETEDAGHRRALPDAAASALTDPVGRADAGSAVLSCVDALRRCLASSAKPSTCAEAARTCLTSAHDARKHE